jgi:hypothetical protein
MLVSLIGSRQGAAEVFTSSEVPQVPTKRHQEELASLVKIPRKDPA